MNICENCGSKKIKTNMREYCPICDNIDEHQKSEEENPSYIG